MPLPRGSRSLMTSALCLAVLPLACSDTTAPEERADLEIHASMHGPPEQGGGSGIRVDVDRVYLVVGRVKLEKAGSTLVDFLDERSIVIALEPAAGPILAIAADVPDGAYKELEIAIDKLEAGHPHEQALVDAYPALSDASVLIEGTVADPAATSESFSFATDLDIDLELTFDPPLTPDGAAGPATLISLMVDVTSWFRDQSGKLLDPRDPADRSAIESNVQRSIELFEGMVRAAN